MQPKATPLYKYMRREHAAMLLKSGSLRIGTLAEFRDTEGHGDQIGDADEGRDLPIEHVENASNDDPDSISSFVRDVISVPQGPGRLTIRGATFGKVVDGPPAYVFCLSECVDAAQMELMGYDTCVRIAEPERFIASLTSKLNQLGHIKGAAEFGPCEYRERERDWRGPPPLSLGFIKPPKYSSQREVRALWPAARAEAEPVVVRVLSAARFCSLVDPRESAV